MSRSKNETSYLELVEQIESVDSKICDMKISLKKLQSYIKMKLCPEEEKVCMDEIEADKAANEAINEMCLNILLESEPQGEA
jgi:hypothetical protein